MSEMVDRVAEALMMARHPNAPLTFAEVVRAVEMGSDPTVLEGFRRDARAAIKAIADSLGEMADEGYPSAWAEECLRDAALRVSDGGEG